MPVKVIMGLQWGDEGKGKVVDQMVNDWADVVIRYQGGNNAGHTIYDEQNEKYVLHALPSGVLKSGCMNVIAKGCVIEPLSLYEELSQYPDVKLKVSDQCPLIFPHHILKDRMHYQAVIGTTAKGIGPAYSEYIARDNFTMFDLFFKFDEISQTIEDKILKIFQGTSGESFLLLREIFRAYLQDNHFDADLSGNAEFSIARKIQLFLSNEYFPQLRKAIDKLRPMICNTDELIQELYSQNKNIILEGAQGWGLDVWGRSYPNVTSSSPNIGGVLTSTGLNHKQIDEVIGVVKIYKSKVGSGNHSTEDHLTRYVSEFIDDVREKLGEFGATTGRPRRLGWLNMDEVKLACQTNGVDHIVITRVDSIQELATPSDTFFIYHENEYKEYKMWDKPDFCTSLDTFFEQEALTFFVNDIKQYTQIPTISLSYGPKRNQIKWSY